MRFTKMQGAGNDFIILDLISGAGDVPDPAELARNICRRRLSVGADGLMVVLPPSGEGNVAMEFYNSDGTVGEMCGNGARCLARYAHDHGYAGDHQVIEAKSGIVYGQRIEDDLYCVRLTDVTRMDASLGIPWDGKILPCTYVELGDPAIPHAVVDYPEFFGLSEAARRTVGAHIRRLSIFPKGANVTFYTFLTDDSVRAVTYERGVEDFTLACGTGAGSTAAALKAAGAFPGETLTLEYPGGTLQVSLILDGGRITDIYLTGPAVTVAEGEYIGK